MAKVASITVNPFQENTYVIYDNSGECIVIDPGVSNTAEQHMLEGIIHELALRPVALINTHCHIDHILGNKFVADRYSISLGIHREDEKMLIAATDRSMNFGIAYDPSPLPAYYLEHGQTLSFGESELEVRFVPGHAPGHIVLIDHSAQWVIAGDTLFKQSIGRTDLPFGDFGTLEQAIRTQLYTLPDAYVVWPGHGPHTTIGDEKRSNPFVRP
ncbi:MAG TPA: MBL fold metallo-hydrolase [Luteibaculaceae bacterium]|nr:MBL fold metallo-hydrolase [Luteibaculaceae bacterium]